MYVYIYTSKGGQGAEAEGDRAGAVGHVRDGEELFKPIGFKEHQGKFAMRKQRPQHPQRLFIYIIYIYRGGYMSYEEEDTCHMRRRIHVI
jgi:hypothetical protein